MMARLEEAEHGAGLGSREWLDRAVTAMPDPRYICATCGGESLEWRSLCPHCGSFDALAWRTPAWATPGSTLPISAKPPSAEERELLTKNSTEDR
jgi:HemY protein